MSGRFLSPASLGRFLRRCLEEGNSIEIDGLGLFRPHPRFGFEFVPDNRPQVFVAYAVEDAEPVDLLCRDLERFGFDPWTDRRKLLPGQNWPRAIERAIEISDFFLACLSTGSVRKRGRFQSELRYALDCANLMPHDDVYFIPIRLDDCPVPREISKTFQYVNLFPDRDKGLRRIVSWMRKQHRRRTRPRAA